MLMDKSQIDFMISRKAEEFFGLLEKIDKEKPDSKDIADVEIALLENPELWQVEMSLTNCVLWQFINMLTPNKKHKLLLEAEAMSMKEKMGYSSSNQLERLIIDEILVCWAGLNYVEGRVALMTTEGGYTWDAGGYWQDTLSKYQKRYFRAIETLARIKRLNKGIALQVNIAKEGGQQVNVNEINK